MRAIFAFIPLVSICAAQEIRLSLLDEPARLLNASQQTVLRVQAADASGSPVSGEPVTFTAPASSRKGLFVGDDGSATLQTVTVATGDDGVASATIEAGTQIGPYYVYAQAAHGKRAIAFGVSTVPLRTEAPALAASAARKTLESRLPDGGVVYGPVWVPSLTAVTAAGPASIYSPSSTYTTAATGSWLFWVDGDPDRLFGHSVQYVVVDAARTDPALPNARFIRELWWPVVKLSGASSEVQLLPWPQATPAAGDQPAACAIVASFSANPGSGANQARMIALWKGLVPDVRAAWDRDSFQAAIQSAAGQNCSAVYLHITADGYPPRVPQPNAPGTSLGGLVLPGRDLLDYTDLAGLLLPLKGKGRMQFILDASYGGNAAAAFSGLGLAGDLLTATDEAGSEAMLPDGTPFSAELARLWGAAIDAGRPFDLRQMQASSRFRVRYARIAPDGPKVLPLPNLSFPGPGQIQTMTVSVPSDMPAGAPVSAKVTVAEPRIAEVDPLSGSADAGKDLPALNVLASSTGVTTYTVQLSSGGGSPAYQGAGSIAVGQEVACSPSRLTVTAGFQGEVRVSAGTLYDPLFNGSSFRIRLLDERMARLVTPQVTLHGSPEIVQLTGYVPGSTTMEVSGTRAWGQPYTACVVEVVVAPEFGDGTLNATLLIGQTDASMQRVVQQIRAQSNSVEDVAVSGDLLCATGFAPNYRGLGITPQAFGQSFQGKADAQTFCFWPAASGNSTSFRFSTLFGGSDVDTPVAVVPDQQGNVWVVGYTESKDLPVSPGGRNYLGKKDIFTAKISRFGDRLLFSSYFGGVNDDIPTAAAVDPAGNLFIAGYTQSRDFPVTNQAIQSSYQDGSEAFVIKINGATGAMMSGTLYGGLGDDAAYALAVDAKGYVYIAGQTASHNLPSTPGAFQKAEADGPPCLQVGITRPCPDAFVAKMSPDLARLEYATFLGGTDNDYAYGIAVDAAGNAAVVGGTSSRDFPVSAGVLQPAHRPELCYDFYLCQDAFVTILNPSGTALVASTLLGGNLVDEGAKVAFDRAGNVYVYGRTGSTNLPVTPGAFQTQNRGGGDAFLAAFPPGLKSLLGLTYFGSTGSDNLGGLAVTPDGKVFFGITSSEKDLRP